VTGPRSLRSWAAVAWALCLVAAAAEPRAADHRSSQAAAVTGTTIAADSTHPAVLPARVADDVRMAAQTGGSSRTLVPAAVLAALLGVPAARRRRGSAGETDHRLLQTRRYAIALRAPPLRLA
jgi:hypothetical protein